MPFSPTIEEAARGLLLHGVAPDDLPWNGGPPKFSMDYTSPTVTQPKKRTNPDKTVTFTANLAFGKQRLYSGGLTCESPLIARFLKQYPLGEDTLIRVFTEIVNQRWSQYEQGLQQWFQTQPWKPFMSMVGADRENWDNPKLVKLGPAEWHDPDSGILQRGRLQLAVHVTAAIKATPKAPVIEAPFSTMSDRELDSWIERWENDAPENFWMDGELHLARPAAYAYYRKQWRAMTPRSQVNLMQSLQGRYASQRVASRFLAKWANTVWTRETVVDKIWKEGWGTKGKTWPEDKDKQRINDIVKNGKNRDGIIKLALKQARLIREIDKAVRRGAAAEAHTGSQTMREVVSQIFYTRALELARIGTMIVPEVAPTTPKEKPKFDPPAIPPRLIPQTADEWEFYSSQPGANQAAKGMAQVMVSVLESVGRNVTPNNTDAANAKAIRAIFDRISKALDVRGDYGAHDTEPRYHARDTVRRYLKLYLDSWEYRQTFDAVDDSL